MRGAVLFALAIAADLSGQGRQRGQADEAAGAAMAAQALAWATERGIKEARREVSKMLGNTESEHGRQAAQDICRELTGKVEAAMTDKDYLTIYADIKKKYELQRKAANEAFQKDPVGTTGVQMPYKWMPNLLKKYKKCDACTDLLEQMQEQEWNIPQHVFKQLSSLPTSVVDVLEKKTTAAAGRRADPSGTDKVIPDTLVVVLPGVRNLTADCNEQLDGVRDDATKLDAAVACEDARNTTEHCLTALQGSQYDSAIGGVADSLHECADIGSSCANDYSTNAVFEVRLSGLGISSACSGEINALPGPPPLDCEDGKYLSQMVSLLNEHKPQEAASAIGTGISACTKGAITAACGEQVGPPIMRNLLLGAAGDRVRAREEKAEAGKKEPATLPQPAAGVPAQVGVDAQGNLDTSGAKDSALIQKLRGDLGSDKLAKSQVAEEARALMGRPDVKQATKDLPAMLGGMQDGKIPAKTLAMMNRPEVQAALLHAGMPVPDKDGKLPELTPSQMKVLVNRPEIKSAFDTAERMLQHQLDTIKKTGKVEDSHSMPEIAAQLPDMHKAVAETLQKLSTEGPESMLEEMKQSPMWDTMTAGRPALQAMLSDPAKLKAELNREATIMGFDEHARASLVQTSPSLLQTKDEPDAKAAAKDDDASIVNDPEYARYFDESRWADKDDAGYLKAHMNDAEEDGEAEDAASFAKEEDELASEKASMTPEGKRLQSLDSDMADKMKDKLDKLSSMTDTLENEKDLAVKDIEAGTPSVDSLVQMRQGK